MNDLSDPEKNIEKNNQFLHDENDAVTLRVLELQLIFFLWKILRPSLPSQCNTIVCTHQAHHLSNHYLLNTENYQKKRKFYSMKMRKRFT